MLTFALVIGGILGGALALVIARPKPSQCPGCGCMTLAPNRGGSLWFCSNCRAEYRFIGGTFIGPPRSDRALPPVSTVVKR